MRRSLSIFNSNKLLLLMAKIAVFIVLLLVLDDVIGSVCEYFFFKTMDGDTGGQINGILRSENELLIFGSSRAESHYVPSIFQKELGLSTYNCGFKGSNIIYDYSLEQLVFDKYIPKIMIYDYSYITSKYMPDKNPYDTLYPMYPFYRNKKVFDLIKRRDKFEKYKFFSRIYPYNSKVHSILIFNIFRSIRKSDRGYRPQFVSLPMTEKLSNIKSVKFDEVLVDRLIGFCDEAIKHKVRLFVCLSPRYKTGTYLIPERAERFIADHNIPIIDFGLNTDKEFLDTTLFRDANHLNDSGAKVFSKRLAVKLREKFGVGSIRIGR